MKLQRIVLRKMVMPLKTPFQTSFGSINVRTFIMVEAHGKDAIGYAEVSAEAIPQYNEECVGTAWHVMEKFLIPLLYQYSEKLNHPSEIAQVFHSIKGNYLAKSGLENAVWDLYAKERNSSLSNILGGKKKEVEVGVSIGIQKDIPTLVSVIGNYIEEGYQRIKLKIQPGWDINMVKEVRRHFPDTPLMVDANSAYTLDDMDLLQQLDGFNLQMIEQPLAYNDIIDHSILQQQLKTPICLDESIHNVDDVRKALYLGSCQIINIKIGRVGGHYEAKRIHDFCEGNNIPVWCGGMLEAGIGRAHNIAISSLTNFTYPGDTSASSRYWYEDIIEPEVLTTPEGTIIVPEGPGIGYKVLHNVVDRYSDYVQTYRN